MVGLSISDGIKGFESFLSYYPDCSFGERFYSDSRKINFNFRYRELLYDGTYYRSVKRLVVRIGALTQYKDTSKSITHWSLLQRLVYHYGNSVDINEMHFAVDIPYRYADVSIKPAEFVSQPQSYPSTKYFDTSRKTHEEKSPVHDFVIYDKCRKCRLAVPLTRIELRLKFPPSTHILRDETARKKLANKVHRKFAKMKIKVGRGTVRTNQCDWSEVLENAIKYIKSDDKIWERIFSHRQHEVAESSTTFKSFMQHCAKNHIYTNKPHLHTLGQSYLQSISPKHRIQIHETITGYNAYDKDWYKDNAFGLKLKKRARWTDEGVRDYVLFSLIQGKSQANIAEELDISDSTLSKWLHGYARVEDSKFMNLFHFNSVIE